MWNPVVVRYAVPPALTVRQVATALKVTTHTVRHWIRIGRIAAARPGLRQWRITRKELTRCLRQGMGQETPGGKTAPAPTPSAPNRPPLQLAITPADAGTEPDDV